MQTVRYGSDPSQFGELSLPDPAAHPAPWPVVAVVHGGFWRTSYGLELGRPLAADLVGAGVAVWNIEYRRVGAGSGGGGGWPVTGLDAAAALDALAGEVQTAAGGRLDRDRVVALGHSAGGQLAGWLAARTTSPSGSPGAEPAVRLRGAVAQAGVLDLLEAARQQLGLSATQSFLGGSPDEVPTAYAQASPAARSPLPVPVVCVHGTSDQNVPFSQSQRFVAADQRAGGRATLRTVDGDHFALIDPGSSAWQVCRSEVLRLLG